MLIGELKVFFCHRTFRKRAYPVMLPDWFQRCLCLALLDRLVYFMQQDLDTAVQVSNHCLLEVQSCYRQVHFMLVLVYLLPDSRHVHKLLASMAC